MYCLGTGFGHEFVDEANISKCASYHHVIVATAATIAVELSRGQSRGTHKFKGHHKGQMLTPWPRDNEQLDCFVRWTRPD